MRDKLVESNNKQLRKRQHSLQISLFAFLVFGISLLFSLAQPVFANSADTNKTKWDYWHKVTRVIDGDTVRALVDGKEETIRIIGIDAPELNGKECYGVESSAKAREFLGDKWIKLEADTSQDARDKYDRLLAYVWFDSGTDFGRRLIEEGYAFEYTYSKPYNKQAQYKETQTQSKSSLLGLWATNTCNGVPQVPVSVVKPTTAPRPAPAAPRPVAPPQTPPTTGAVKKSSTSICHAPGTTYYDRTTNFTAYASVQACLNSGGRLPLR